MRLSAVITALSMLLAGGVLVVARRRLAAMLDRLGSEALPPARAAAGGVID